MSEWKPGDQVISMSHVWTYCVADDKPHFCDELADQYLSVERVKEYLAEGLAERGKWVAA